MQTLSDEQLIEVYRSKEDGRGKKALDHLYNRYSKPMFNFFFFALQNDSNKAKDFVHDLFIKVIENQKSFDNNRLFRAWIYRIASNMCKNELRANSVIQKYKKHIVYSSSNFVIKNEREKELSESINKLNQDYRSIIVLRFKMKLSIKEIAEVYECPEGTVKSRLFVATKELSKLYKQQ
jgi:RNA polymerase sigma-70 factor, ECF subfamily